MLRGKMESCARNYLSNLQMMSRLIMIKKSSFHARSLSQSAIRFMGRIKQSRPRQESLLGSARYFSNRPWQVQNRRQNWGSNNPIFSGDNLLYSIIGLNVMVFGAWKYSESDREMRRFLHDNFTISSNGVMREFRIHTFLTSIFSHRDPGHLLSNSVAFYFFGQSCLSYLGGPRFLALYIGGGLISSFAQVLGPLIIPRDFPSRFKVSNYASAAGSSSAVAAVVAWNILKSPRSTVMLFFVLPVPAAILGVTFLTMEVASLAYGSNSGNAAHLGGAAFGAAYFASNC